MKLQAICSEFISLIFTLRRTDNVKHIMTKYNLLTISQIYELELAVLMYNYHKNILPHDIGIARILDWEGGQTTNHMQ